MRSTMLVALLCLGVFSVVQANRTHLVEDSGCLGDRLLSRKVRGLVFPEKASVLLTAALTKIIVGGRPSGLQYSLEFDIYHPLPDTVEGWQPKILKRFRPKTTPAPKRRWDWSHNPYYNQYEYSQLNQQKSFYETSPYNSDSIGFLKPPTYGRPPTNGDSFYQTPWSMPMIKDTTYQPQEEVYESWSQVPTWKLNRGYRERREIFDQLEAMGKVFQIDLRSCIKRAMCELRARVAADHHQGFLMEDLMRIVLTVPEEILDPKYKHHQDIRNCARFYSPSCPYKVLDFLTKNGRKM